MIGKSRYHLTEMHESYGEHMAFAFEMAWLMITGGVMIIIHALVPALCERSGSKRILLLNEKLRKRQERCRK